MMKTSATKNGFFAVLMLLLFSSFASALEGSYILRGDVNWDGIVDSADMQYMADALGSVGPYPDPVILADVNGDGAFNIVDVTYLNNFINKGGATPVGNYKGKAGVLMRGDTNWDGSITTEDATLIANYLGGLGPHPEPKILADTNGDQKTTITDVSKITIFLNDPTKWILPIYRGDVNWDGIVDSADMQYMADALGSVGPYPDPVILADVNGDGAFNIVDVTYLNNFINKGGTPPVGVYAGSASNPTITKQPSATPIGTVTVTTLPSPTSTGGATPAPTNPIITGGSSTDTLCSTNTICVATHGSGSYCDGGKCSSCQFACVADNKCIACCAKAGRIDPDCSAPTATALATPRPTSRQTYTPTPYVSNYVMEVPDDRVNDVLQEIRDSGEDTSAIEEELRKAQELELQGKEKEAAQTKASAMDKINALFTKVSQNKKSFVWGLAILIIVLIGGAAFYNSFKQGGNIESEEQEKLKPNEALRYDRVVAETLEENKPFKLDIKEKKKDA